MSGYSTATISRVITNKGNVRPETKEAIEKLLLEQNYRTNIMELRQARRKNTTIMIITGDIDNWYYMELIRALSRALDKEGFSTLIAYTDNQTDKEERFLQTAIEEDYAGAVFMNVSGSENIKEILLKEQFPVVFLNRGIKLAYFNTVCNDNYHGAYQATTYLIRKGHKRIGHLMGSVFSPAAIERRRGFSEAMEDHGILITDHTIYQGHYNWESGYEYAEYIIKKHLDFTAVFLGNYQMTEGFQECMHIYGMRIPEDISILCFDETPSMRRGKITTICADPQKMSNSAIELLLAEINGDTSGTKRIFQEPVLIERESVKQLS